MTPRSDPPAGGGAPSRSEEKAIALAREEKALVAALSSDLRSIEYTPGGVRLQTLEDALRFSKWVALSGFAPQFKTTSQVFTAIELGKEAGLSPLRSLRSVQVVENSIGWTPRAGLAMVRASRKLGGFRRVYTGRPFEDDFGCELWAKRADTGEEMTSAFTVADAKTAGLWARRTRSGAPTPWVTFPRRMLYYRALGFLLADLFEDVLGGWPDAADLADRALVDGEERDVTARARELERIHSTPAASPRLEQLAGLEPEIEPAPPVHDPAAEPPEPEPIDVDPEPELAPPPPEPPAEPFAGPLPMSIGAEIGRRVQPLLEQHQERAAAQLEEMARERLGAGASAADVCKEVRAWTIR